MPAVKRQPTLQQHVAAWRDCRRCALCDQRGRIVLGRGPVPTDVLFVGEAPGESEDATGLPFVGPAGKLFDRIVVAALDASGIDHEVRTDGPCLVGLRPRLAFTNLVACFPKEAKREGVNEPPRESIKACAPRLLEFIELARPKLVVTVGALAEKFTPSVRCDARVSLIHPAAILRANAVQADMATRRCVVVLADAFAALPPF